MFNLLLVLIKICRITLTNLNLRNSHFKAGQSSAGFKSFFFWYFFSDSEEKADETEHLATEATIFPSPAQSISPIPPSMTTADENKEQKEVAIADQVTGGTKEETKKENEENESGDVRKEDESPAISTQTGTETTAITFLFFFPWYRKTD